MSGHPGVPQFHLHRREDTSWLERAACCGIDDPEMFFDPDRYKYALLVCRSCPVTQQCRAARRDATGVWGGCEYAGKLRCGGDGVDDKDFPHGTERGYKRHVRAAGAESACVPCRQAATRNAVDRQHKRRRDAR